MKNLTVEYTRVGTKIHVHIVMDNVVFDDEDYNFCDKAFAEGMMTDEFHHATGNRYKEPSLAILRHPCAKACAK